ncbi:DUF6624 domain-containing protein [Spirosoma litoris]
MRNLLIIVFLLTATYYVTNAQEAVQYPRLVLLLDSLAKVDEAVQQAIIKAESNHQTESQLKQLYQQELATFNRHQTIIEQLAKQNGFLGFHEVGTEGALHFWLLVQHSDSTPKFQKHMLTLMKKEVRKDNADLYQYASLVDRVQVNTGKPQVYGTQVTYIDRVAVLKGAYKAKKINKSRLAIGLDSLQTYLDSMTKLYRATYDK